MEEFVGWVEVVGWVFFVVDVVDDFVVVGLGEVSVVVFEWDDYWFNGVFFYGLGYDSLVFVGFYWYFCFYICYCVDEFGLGVGGVDYYFGFYCVFVGF